MPAGEAGNGGEASDRVLLRPGDDQLSLCGHVLYISFFLDNKK